MVNLVQNYVSLKPQQATNNTKTSNAISFKAAQNPLTSVRFTGNKQLVAWPKSDTMGQVKFSPDSKVVMVNDALAGDQVIAKVVSNKNQISLYDKAGEQKARVDLGRGVKPSDIQVGYQDNKGGFALKVWDKDSKTAFVLFDNKNDPAIVQNDRFKAKVGNANPLSFLGTKASKPVANSEAKLNKAIEDALVIGMFGGFGTRLLAVSDPNTKPTTGLGSNSFEVNMVKTVADSGFKNIGASLYFKPDLAKADIEGAKDKGRIPQDLTIAYAEQNADTGNLGTAGAVRHTAEHIVTAKVAEKLDGKTSAVAKQILSAELGAELASKVMATLNPEKGNLGNQLKQVAIENPEIRAQIFEKKADEIPFVAIVSGDHVTNIDMKEFAKTHLDNNAQFTLALREIDEAEMVDFKAQGKSPYGHAALTEDSKIKEFNEKPKYADYTDDYKWLNTGVYIVSPKVLKEYIPSEAAIKRDKAAKGEGAKAEGCDFGKNVIPALVKQGVQLQAHKVRQHWADVGNNVALQDELTKILDDINCNGGTSKLLPDQQFKTTPKQAISVKADVESVEPMQKDYRLLIADNAKVDDIKVGGTVYIGPDAKVDDGTYKNVWITKQEQPLHTGFTAMA
jgi:NDP-sugar pyrophosphorylase family protein